MVKNRCLSRGRRHRFGAEACSTVKKGVREREERKRRQCWLWMRDVKLEDSFFFFFFLFAYFSRQRSIFGFVIIILPREPRKLVVQMGRQLIDSYRDRSIAGDDGTTVQLESLDVMAEIFFFFFLLSPGAWVSVARDLAEQVVGLDDRSFLDGCLIILLVFGFKKLNLLTVTLLLFAPFIILFYGVFD